MTDDHAQTCPPGEHEVSLVDLGILVLRHRRLILAITLAAAILAAAVAVLTPQRFTATASFVPQTTAGGLSSSLGGLAGLAGQFGLSIPGGSGGESPEFYSALLTSREILGGIASMEFKLQGGERAPSQVGTLADILGLAPPNSTPELKREAGIRWMIDRSLAISTGRQTGIVSVAVTTPRPDLSQALVERLLEMVNQFNLRARQSKASEERAFVEVRLAEVRDSLRRAEDRLEHFLESNRQWMGSPELTFQRERLQRQVLIQQQLHTVLAEAFEQARIAEVRNTPVITVLDRPERPIRADSRRRLLKLALGSLIGLGLGVASAFAVELKMRTQQVGDPAVDELRGLWAQTGAELRGLTRLRRGRMT